jgi:ferredoxin/flavodoxin---NADP+ reductase
MSTQGKHVIIVAGAGPAGMAVASSLSKAGHEIIILNRDIKFGGLAEYGIFPAKLKLRGGLKKQYWELLERTNVHYFGNVSIGHGKDITVEEVRNLGASAVVFSVWAQGTQPRRSAWKGIRPKACSMRRTSYITLIDSQVSATGRST